MAGHNGNIVINIFLEAAKKKARGFGLILLVVPLTENTLDGDRVVEYASLSDAEDAEAAGFISAVTLAQLTSLFGQPIAPEAVLVAYRNDSGSPETWAAAFTAIRALRDDWYAVAIQTHTDAAIVAVSGIVEAITPKRLFMAQSSDSSWLDSGVPSGFTTIVSNERTGLLWCDDNETGGDAAYLANRLGFDPDEKSVPWALCEIAAIAEYATPLTDSQLSAAKANNANVLADFGSYSNVVDPGCNLGGRPISELLSADWLEARIRENVADLAVKLANRGEKITIDPRGQGLVQAVVEGWLQQGEAVKHFKVGQTLCTPLAITDADIDAQRLRFDVAAQFATSARKFTFNLYLSRTGAVNEA